MINLQGKVHILKKIAGQLDCTIRMTDFEHQSPSIRDEAVFVALIESRRIAAATTRAGRVEMAAKATYPVTPPTRETIRGQPRPRSSDFPPRIARRLIHRE
ncbi:hypothetical protein LBMAG52_00150 [Planctomycetia bacterium]|nr:hypothetical protein LBMAG52_00150 [Planctomycetia bacterium]